MKDKYGDKITVGASESHPTIDIHFEDGEDGITMILTPKKARKLIRKIQEATSLIEIRQFQHSAVVR